jgi:transposase
VSNKELIAQKDAIISKQSRTIEHLEFQLAQLQKLIYGSKREKFIPTVTADQMNLFEGEQQDQAQEASEEQTEQITYTRKKSKEHPGRNALPSHLPVEEIVIEPDEDFSQMEKIGEEVTETLEYTEASLKIKRVIRPKYVDRKSEKIHTAPLPERPFPKLIAETSLLAHILVSKFVDHLPYYRQIKRFDRDFQWKVSQSTINNWMAACCTLLKPLYEQMQHQVLESDYIQADESPIKVLDPDKKGKTHLGYQWVYLAPQKGIVVFHYRRGRGMHGPKEFLMQYQGRLQCDGYKVYDKIGQRQGIELIGCMVHARRKFYEAKDSDEKRSQYALNIFKQIYGIERENKQKSINEKQIVRLNKIKPLMNQLLDWIQNESLLVLPKSPIGKAMTYYQNQWPKLKNILLHPDNELDNNLIENKIRPLALGRKNYLFAGSDRGAEWAAMMYSFFGTCKIQNANPYEWLVDAMNRIGNTSILDLEKLLPRNQNQLDR